MKHIVAAFLILLTLLSACEGTGDSVSTQKTAKAVTDPSPEVLKMPFDASPLLPEYPLVTEPTTIRLVMPVPGQEPNAGIQDLFSAFTQTTGISLDYDAFPNETYLEGLELLVASGEPLDLILSAPAYMTNTELSGNLIPLDDLIEAYAPNYIRVANNCYDGVLSLIEESGEIMQLYRFYEEPQMTPGLGTVIREDWLMELGMDLPETYDDYAQLLIAMKNRYDPDLPFRMLPEGVISGDLFTAGFGISLGTSSAFQGIFQQDGVVKFGALEPGFTDYITLIRDWYDQGIITSAYTDTVELGSNSYLIDLSTGASGVFFVPVSAYHTLEGMCEFPISPAMDPVRESGDVTHLANSRATSIYASGLSIPQTCENPELVMQAADWFYSEEAIQIGNYGAATTPGEDDVSAFAEMTLEDWELYTTDLQGTLQIDRIQWMLSEDTVLLSVWNQQKDTADMLPPVCLDEDQRYTYEEIMLDVGTYVDGCVAWLIRGEMAIEEIAEVQEKIREMGLEEAMDLLQEALDHYR